MRIALDATYSVGRNLSGVGVYSRELLARLPAVIPESEFLFCYRPHRILKSFEERLPPRCHRRLLWKGRAPSTDLFHGLNQRLDSAGHRRAVATFHDLFVLSGDYSTPEFRARFAEQARLAAERAHLIIAVSEFTARQLCDLLRVERSRIRVIHHGVRRQPVVAPAARRERVILFVGAIQRRKNTARLVEAFEQINAPGWRLVLAGALGFEGERIAAAVARSPRREAIELAGYVDDARLEQLYSQASIFAFPSLDEGFGMPVLEAMSRGIPVLTSNASALPEVAGGAALLVEPEDSAAIGAGLQRLVDEEGFRSELSQKGVRRAAEFSWEKAAQDTWNVYRELLS